LNTTQKHPFRGHCIKQKIKVYNTLHTKGIHFAGMMSNKKESNKNSFVIKGIYLDGIFSFYQNELVTTWRRAKNLGRPEEIQMGS